MTTIQSWLRGLTHGSVPTLNNSCPSAARTRNNRYRPSLERLEDRNLLASYDLGFAFGLGSTGIESANAVATDTAGNVLVAGNFNSPILDLDPGPGSYVLLNGGGYDGYAAKYDPTGNLLWGVQVGGIGNGSITDVAVDGAGNVLIAGPFAGSIEIGAPGQPPMTLTNSGISEGFLAKLDPAGNALWARTFGTAPDPRLAQDITTDDAGNVFATGREGNRMFVAKYSADGAAVWTQVVSGSTGTVAFGQGVAVDTAGNVVVGGAYRGKIDFNPDPKNTNFLTSVGTKNPSLDAFVLKLNATGAYVWAGSMGGPNDDNANEVAIDGVGNVLVLGSYGVGSPNDFDPGQRTLNLAGSDGAFLVKLDPNRNLIWGHSEVGSRSMALDAAGNVYTTGQFSGTIDADPGPGTFNLTAGGTGDVFVSKVNSSGSFVWAADILRGGPGSNGSSQGIAVDGSGNIYTTGYFRGTADFDPSAASYSLTATPDGNANLFSDAFVSKLVPLNALQAAGGMAPSSAASDTVFASLGTASGSDTSLKTPSASVSFSTIQTSATPLRVEMNLTALQPTLALTANSAPISSSAPRKTARTVDAVFDLLGR